MIIRAEQMEALRTAGDDSLAAELTAHARTFHNPAYSDADLFSISSDSIAVARSFGLDRPQDIAAFASLRIVISLRFYLEPSIDAVLSDPSLHSSEKIGLLSERITSAAWDAAARL